MILNFCRRGKEVENILIGNIDNSSSNRYYMSVGRVHTKRKDTHMAKANTPETVQAVSTTTTSNPETVQAVSTTTTKEDRVRIPVGDFSLDIPYQYEVFTDSAALLGAMQQSERLRVEVFDTLCTARRNSAAAKARQSSSWSDETLAQKALLETAASLMAAAKNRKKPISSDVALKNARAFLGIE